MSESMPNTLWLEKYRPTTMSEYVTTTERKAFFNSFIQKERFPNLLLYGGYGIGKTTIAKILARDFSELSSFDWHEHTCTIRFAAVDPTELTEQCINRMLPVSLPFIGKKIWILDEFDKLHQSHQHKFLGVLEEVTDNNGIIIIANDIDKVVGAIQNRLFCLSMDYKNSEKEEMTTALTQFGEKVLGLEGVKFAQSDLANLASRRWNCPRSFIKELEIFSITGELKIF